MPGGRIRESFSKLFVAPRNTNRDREAIVPIPTSTVTTAAFVPEQAIFSTPVFAPGDESQALGGHKVSPEDVRELHELIRRRHELDTSIWRKRKCVKNARSSVKLEMDRSDAALVKIISLVRAWDTPDAWETEDDLRKLREVRKAMEESGKRDWAAHPPWEEEAVSPPQVERLAIEAERDRLSESDGARPPSSGPSLGGISTESYIPYPGGYIWRGTLEALNQVAQK